MDQAWCGKIGSTALEWTSQAIGRQREWKLTAPETEDLGGHEAFCTTEIGSAATHQQRLIKEQVGEQYMSHIHLFRIKQTYSAHISCTVCQGQNHRCYIYFT